MLHFSERKAYLLAKWSSGQTIKDLLSAKQSRQFYWQGGRYNIITWLRRAEKHLRLVAVGSCDSFNLTTVNSKGLRGYSLSFLHLDRLLWPP